MANNTNRLAGVANISVDGVTYLLSGEFTYSSADTERKTLTGQDQVHGYSEMPRAPFISCTLRDAGTLTVKGFNAMTDVTIHAELANGKTITGRNMWTVDAQEVKTQESTFDVRFEGMTGSVSEN
ncbi:phage tail tube protein [Acinetobacter venetianus]|uniref:Phage tail tube protein n=1 Tax=Acinetobacter venetianus TaxID=52133 RepID=A0A150HQ94_9GAMM|nr:phage tail tube protein [Acinetobacter venetianus]KXZ68767.1 Phage tail tube protein [Acinetobacter venetianus]